MWGLQPRLEKRGRGAFKLIEHARLRAAYDFLQLRCDSGELDGALGAWWAPLAQRTGIAVRARSGFYRSAPVQADGPPYANCVVCVETSLEPRVLLRTTAN